MKKRSEHQSSIIEKLESELADMFKKSSSHDLYHLRRVMNLALHIQEKEGGDREVIAISALLHDVHRLMQLEQGRYVEPHESLHIIEKILTKCNVDVSKIKKILHCVEYHEEYSFTPKGKTVSDIETLIIQDADNLDALGAMGIGRTFTYSGEHHRPMWDPTHPIKDGKYIDSSLGHSSIHHFYDKLLKLKDDMNTNTGKAMALHRHKFIEQFLKEFFDEWDGKI